MTGHSYDVAIAYRIYPRVSKSPFVFPDDKFRLSEVCLKSFKASLGTLKIKVWALLDGCPPEYEELFRRHFNDQELELVRMDGVGNAATFAKQVEILSNQNLAEYVYFAEDDYFYLPNQFSRLLNFLARHEDADFVSAYDHPGHYARGISYHRNYLRIFEGRHWRSSSSICLTFLTRKSTLRACRKVFQTFTRGNYDASIWMSLTKYHVGNPVLIFQYVISDVSAFKSIVKAWLFCWRQIVFGKRRTLWIPVPAIATHMERDFMAPVIDWPNIIREVAGNA